MTALVLWSAILGSLPLVMALTWRGLEGLAAILSHFPPDESLLVRQDRDSGFAFSGHSRR